MINTMTHGKKVITFGRGSIQLSAAYISEKGILALTTTEERPIGSSQPLLGSLDEKIDTILDSEVIIEFENIKGLEVMILKLQEVRALMLNYDLDQIEKWKEYHSDITAIYQPNLMIDGGSK